MSNITYIYQISDESISTSISIFAAKFAVAFGFLLLLPCMLCCIREKKFNLKNTFHIKNYKELDLEDVELTKVTCSIYDKKKKKDTNKQQIVTEPQNADVEAQLVENEERPKKKYVYFKFDNLNIKIVGNKNKDDDPFQSLNKFVNVILKSVDPTEYEVLLVISSPGGYAFQFELAYSDVKRLTNNGFKVTALIDDYCASGGYMLACACNKIICNKYAKIGSVGVIMKTFNYYNMIEKIGVKQKTFKTGKYKAGFPDGEEYTEEDCKIVEEEINETFDVFKKMVLESRPDIDIELITSAKVWYGYDALLNKLVDQISGVDEYCDNLNKNHDIYVFIPKNKKKSMIKESIDDLVDYSANIVANKFKELISSDQNKFKFL